MVAAAKNSSVPVAVHFDHGKTTEKIKQALDIGFTSVMFDGSHLPFEENAAKTAEIKKLASQYGADCEGEIGCVGGSEDGSEDIAINCTSPAQAKEFYEKTGIDAVAVAIGNAHGNYKQAPKLRFDILEEIEKRLPGFPIVLHGASSVPQEFVQEINSLGGELPDAVGIPEEQLRKAASMAVCKINIDSDIRLAMTAGIRRVMSDDPSVFDPRTYLTVARAEVKKMVAAEDLKADLAVAKAMDIVKETAVAGAKKAPAKKKADAEEEAPAKKAPAKKKAADDAEEKPAKKPAAKKAPAKKKADAE